MSPLVRPPEHRLASSPAPAGAVVGADGSARESASSGRRLAVGRFFAALWGASTAGESRARRHRACRGRAGLLAGVVFTAQGCIDSARTAAECEPADAAVHATRDAGLADGGYDADVPEVLPTWVYLHGRPPLDFRESDSFPGQDLCSLTFACPIGLAGFAVEAIVDAGWGISLDASANLGFPFPDDPDLALGPTDQECGYRYSPDPALNFVTIGHEGSIYLRLDTENHDTQPAAQLDLSGCTLSIQTADGIVEPTLVSICLNATPDSCRFLAEIPNAWAPDGLKVLIPPL